MDGIRRARGAATPWAVILCLLGGAWGCSDDPTPIPEARNVARMNALVSSATGVYVGRGLVLTNWHVCVNYFNVLEFGAAWAEQDYPRVFNDPGDGSLPYVEGTSFNDYLCSTTDAQGVVTVSVSTEWKGNCRPASNAALLRMEFSELGLAVDHAEPRKVVYANIGLDLCVVELTAPSIQKLDAALPALRIQATPPTKGQSVVVAGHPQGVEHLAWETCQVTWDSPMPIKDPDTINPSNLVVPSFELQCAGIGPGSSGSPVFDASGAILGLIWTGRGEWVPGNSQGNKVIIGYATSVSAWRALVDAPAGRVNHSRLAALLD